ncbi:unnamed protein product [Moneuplotes crassus]|uniref:Uncharacterized protein n=1 Tax=Euplotes crassus TaxID=5936 RepID=A0AAD2D769_EUPCR|nr:unnamed protein product [Moneuplotes crassus]
MSNLINFDENLSEEFLDESTQVSSVNVSLNLEKNMSKPLFSSKLVAGEIYTSPSCPSGGFLQAPKLLESEGPIATRKRLPFKKVYSYGPKGKSKLQRDISTLLQKAMRMKSVQNFYTEQRNNSISPQKKNKETPCRVQRGFTIHEVAGPACFSS